MKRFLSWVVLYLVSCVTGLFTFLVLRGGFYILTLINDLSSFWRVVIYLFGGLTFLSIIFTPIYYGSVLTVLASEAVKNSKKGVRYIVFSIYMLITSVIYTIIRMHQGSIPIVVIVMLIYYILLMIVGIKCLKNSK